MQVKKLCLGGICSWGRLTALFKEGEREGGRVVADSSHSFWHPILPDGSGIVDHQLGLLVV